MLGLLALEVIVKPQILNRLLSLEPISPAPGPLKLR